MTSRALEREIAEFVGLIESHLARLIHAAHEKTKHLPRGQRDQLTQDILIVAWRMRDKLDPVAEPLATWFERCIFVATLGLEGLSDDEKLVLKALSPAPAAVSHIAQASSYEGAGETTKAPGSDAAQKIGKECPPCWRCRYFDGWLPKREPYAPDWRPVNEMDFICKTIDDRKFEIAKYVTGRYDPALLED